MHHECEECSFGEREMVLKLLLQLLPSSLSSLSSSSSLAAAAADRRGRLSGGVVVLPPFTPRGPPFLSFFQVSFRAH